MAAPFGFLKKIFGSNSPQEDWEKVKSSEEIIRQAEVKALEIGLEKNLEKNLFETEFENRLNQKVEQATQAIQPTLVQFAQNLANLEQVLKQNLAVSEKKNQEFLTQMQKQTVSASLAIDEEARAKIGELLIQFEQKITDFFAEAEQKSMDAISLEIKSARQLIDSYKAQQLSIIDENIVAVLERTLSLVLNKKLSLEDQLDLVYKSLEKAKLEKFLI